MLGGSCYQSLKVDRQGITGGMGKMSGGETGRTSKTEALCYKPDLSLSLTLRLIFWYTLGNHLQTEL